MVQSYISKADIDLLETVQGRNIRRGIFEMI